MVELLEFITTRLTANPSGWWVALPIWAGLIITAWIDARRGIVPDKVLLLSVLLAMVGFLYHPAPYEPSQVWQNTIPLRLMGGAAIYAAIWTINALWYRWQQQGALGMGDAKWSMVAVLGFGLQPVLWAWPLAAALGLVWLGYRRCRGQPASLLFFAPFLCVALIIIKLLDL